MQGSSITLGSKSRGECHELWMSWRGEKETKKSVNVAPECLNFCTPIQKIYEKYNIFYFLAGGFGRTCFGRLQFEGWGLMWWAEREVCSWRKRQVLTHCVSQSVVSSSKPSVEIYIDIFFFFFPWPNSGGCELWRMCSFCGEATSSAGFMCETTPSIPNISFPTAA